MKKKKLESMISNYKFKVSDFSLPVIGLINFLRRNYRLDDSNWTTMQHHENLTNLSALYITHAVEVKMIYEGGKWLYNYLTSGG